MWLTMLTKLFKRLKSINHSLYSLNRIGKIESELDEIKRGLGAVFIYQTGLELYPKDDERIVVSSYHDAVPCHFFRYLKASDYIEDGDLVLDIACGVGYGTNMLSSESNANSVIGVDIDAKTIGYAEKAFSNQRTQFKCASALDRTLFQSESFNKIVSFETIEHVEEDEELVRNLYHWLNKEGMLIASVPNEEVFPFSKDEVPYHVRHYTPDEFEKLLTSVGFTVIEKYKNDRGELCLFDDLGNIEGRQLIYVAKK